MREVKDPTKASQHVSLIVLSVITWTSLNSDIVGYLFIGFILCAFELVGEEQATSKDVGDASH